MFDTWFRWLVRAHATCVCPTDLDGESVGFAVACETKSLHAHLNHVGYALLWDTVMPNVSRIALTFVAGAFRVATMLLKQCFPRRSFVAFSIGDARRFVGRSSLTVAYFAINKWCTSQDARSIQTVMFVLPSAKGRSCMSSETHIEFPSKTSDVKALDSTNNESERVLKHIRFRHCAEKQSDAS